MVTQRLAALIGVARLPDRPLRPRHAQHRAALPVHGLPDEVARRCATRSARAPRRWTPLRARLREQPRARATRGCIAEVVQLPDAESVVLVPMISEGELLGLLVAVNKPGGFSDGRRAAALASSPARRPPSSAAARSSTASAARARLERRGRPGGRDGGGDGAHGAARLVAARLQRRPRLRRGRVLRAGREAGAAAGGGGGRGARAGAAPRRAAALGAARGHARCRRRPPRTAPSWRCRCAPATRRLGRAGGRARAAGGPFGDEELNLLSTAGRPARPGAAEGGQRGRDRAAGRADGDPLRPRPGDGRLRDLRLLFVKATEEAGRLIRADHASVLRFDEADGTLRMFAAWAATRSSETYGSPVFRLGEGVAGRVARDRVPAMVNDAAPTPGSSPRAQPRLAPAVRAARSTTTRSARTPCSSAC